MGMNCRGVMPLITLVGWLAATSAFADGTEEATLKKLKELNKVTGTEPMQGALKVLLDDPEGLAAGLIDRSGGRSRTARASWPGQGPRARGSARPWSSSTTGSPAPFRLPRGHPGSRG